MSERRPKRKGPFGLSPLTLLAAACLLVIVGMSGGVILDLMVNPHQPVRNPAVSHHVPPPVIRTPALLSIHPIFHAGGISPSRTGSLKSTEFR